MCPVSALTGDAVSCGPGRPGLTASRWRAGGAALGEVLVCAAIAQVDLPRWTEGNERQANGSRACESDISGYCVK